MIIEELKPNDIDAVVNLGFKEFGAAFDCSLAEYKEWFTPFLYLVDNKRYFTSLLRLAHIFHTDSLGSTLHNAKPPTEIIRTLGDRFEELAKWLGSDYRTWVAREASTGDVTGYVQFNNFDQSFYQQSFDKRVMKPTDGYVQQIAVESKHRDTGTGTLLLEHSLEHASKQGYENVWAHLYGGETADSFRLFEKLGFKVFDIFPEHYINKVDGALVGLEL
jgi:ribosomal protein S18 acetylase RimI-like enzyme